MPRVALGKSDEFSNSPLALVPSCIAPRVSGHMVGGSPKPEEKLVVRRSSLQALVLLYWWCSGEMVVTFPNPHVTVPRKLRVTCAGSWYASFVLQRALPEIAAVLPEIS